jgi:hypothetical protein
MCVFVLNASSRGLSGANSGRFQASLLLPTKNERGGGGKTNKNKKTLTKSVALIDSFQFVFKTAGRDSVIWRFAFRSAHPIGYIACRGEGVRVQTGMNYAFYGFVSILVLVLSVLWLRPNHNPNTNVNVKGIENVGNSCFAGSAAQMLFRIDFVRDLLLGLKESESAFENLSVEEQKALSGLKRLFRALNDPKIGTVVGHTNDFIPPQFMTGEPGDAAEFIQVSLDLIGKLASEGEKAFRDKVFLQVESNWGVKDYWSAVRVPFPEKKTTDSSDSPFSSTDSFADSPVSLDHLLSRPLGPFGTEFLAGKERIHRISGPVPKVVIISFIRSLYDPKTGGVVKNETPLLVPELLDLSAYQISGRFNRGPLQLKMFLVHRGSSKNGHYVSYVRQTTNSTASWHRIDDSKTSSQTRDEALKAAQDASMCFYS